MDDDHAVHQEILDRGQQGGVVGQVSPSVRARHDGAGTPRNGSRATVIVLMQRLGEGVQRVSLGVTIGEARHQHVVVDPGLRERKVGVEEVGVEQALPADQVALAGQLAALAEPQGRHLDPGVGHGAIVSHLDLRHAANLADREAGLAHP